METGFRHGTNGQMIPRDIITSFSAKYNGEEIFATQFYPASAANPFVTFYTVATESGTIAFTWVGDNGFEVTEEAKIVVE
jgi:sulfur-oxidizing protein SoxZ